MSAAPIADAGIAAARITVMKRFQAKAMDTAFSVIQDTCAKIEAAPSRRLEISLAQGVTLLRSPTASGKTLTLGRIMERTINKLGRKTCWFWFTPYSGLVLQTQDALTADCPALTVRDIRADRKVAAVSDGDVYVTTWASVAASNKLSRSIRRPGEEAAAFDTLIDALRARNFFIGCVIDEAHVNFGTEAEQAAEIYLKVIRPDFTILATATPKDVALERFMKKAGIRAMNRIEVSREEVVSSCLNKVGVKAVHFRASGPDERVLDMQEVAVFAGLQRHRMVKEALTAQGIDLNPLMLIQVENVLKGEPDPVERVREMLSAFGVPVEAIAVHTSGEPDPNFHTLAYNERKEVLVFKMAAATGFDAPRAWTLVSLRKVIGPEFGLQLLGRIMRVHKKLQPFHAYASDPPRTDMGVLDYGYVFLADAASQVGIATAASDLKAIRDGISTVTDNVVMFDIGGGKELLLDADGGFIELLDTKPADGQPETDEADLAPESSSAGPGAPVRSAAFRVQRVLTLTAPVHTPRGDPPGTGRAPPPATSTVPGTELYPLRTDIAFPRNFVREVMPKTMEGLVGCIALQLTIDDSTLNLVQRTRGKVVVTERDVFDGSTAETRSENVPISPLRLAQQSQAAFRFNQSIDERDLKPALVERLRKEVDRKGWAPLEEKDLRRAVDLIALVKPYLLVDACKACLAQVVQLLADQPIPSAYEGPRNLELASKALYKVFPDDMNIEERAFAQVLDDDDTGTVIWWLRNVSNARWAVSIVLPNGRQHYPDFVIGVNGSRKTDDNIALAEVKDDGVEGRLWATRNTDKVRSEHTRYGSAVMIFRDDDGEWTKVAYRPDLRRHMEAGLFTVRDLVWSK